MRKTLRFLCLLALASCLSPLACSAKDLSFAEPVDASHYAAGAGTVVAVRILSIDYEAGIYRFQLVDAEGRIVANGAVFGVNSPTPDEDTAAAEIRAAIAAASGGAVEGGS